MTGHLVQSFHNYSEWLSICEMEKSLHWYLTKIRNQNISLSANIKSLREDFEKGL